MTATAERREEMLGLLAEKSLALACAVQQRALEAETPEEMARLATAFAKLGRSVRQSIALHARLEGERLRGDREIETQAEGARDLASVRKRGRVHRAVERLVWNEHEADEDEAEALLEDLEDRLDALAEAEAEFLAADPDALIAQLATELGLEPPPASPIAAAMAGGGPPAKERAVEGASPRANGHDSS